MKVLIAGENVKFLLILNFLWAFTTQQATSGLSSNDVATLLKQNLLKSFNTTDFLGISIPSLRGEISLSKVTGCIVRCLRRNEASDVGSSDNQSATAAAAARCLS